MATRLISDGGDATGTIVGFDFIQGATVSTVEAATGARSYLLETSGAGADAYVAFLNLGSSAARWTARYRFRDVVSAHNPIWSCANSSGATTILGLALDSSNRLRILVNGLAAANYVGSVGPTMAEDTWYRISVAFAITSTTNWDVAVWVDGTAACSASDADATLSATDTYLPFWGCQTGAAGTFSANLGIYLDDLFVDTEATLDDPGAIVVTAKRPAGLGTNEFDTGIGSGTNRWDRVAEVPINEANGWREATPAAPSNERMPPDAVLASAGLSGATVANLDDDPDSGGTDFATASSNTTNTSVRVSFATPSITPAGTQEFRVQVRKNATAGSGTPTARIDLYENGSLISSGSAQNVTSTTGQVISRTWDMTGRTAAQIECLVAGTVSGGGPSVRAAVDIGAIEWNAAAPAVAAKETYTIEGISTGDVDLTGKTLIARLAWVWAKASASGTAYLIDNNIETAITLATSSALYTRLTDATTYPSGTDQIGLRAVAGDTDTDLYECGAVIAYLGPYGFPVPEWAGANEAPNPSAETDLTGWTFSKTGARVAGGFHGDWGVEVDPATVTNDYTSRFSHGRATTVPAGSTWLVRIWVKQGTGNVEPYALLWDEGFTLNHTVYMQLSGNVYNGWEERYAIVTVPASGPHWIYAEGYNQHATQVAIVDYVEIREVIVDPDLGPNVHGNPSVEVDATGWTPPPSGGRTTAYGAWHGSAAMQIPPEAVLNDYSNYFGINAYSFESHTVAPGEVWRVSIWRKIGTGGTWEVYARVYSSDFSANSNFALVPSGEPFSGWQKYEVEFTVPADRVFICIEGSHHTTTSTLVLDYAEFREVIPVGTYTYTPSGGLTLGGTAPRSRTENVVPVGGVVLSGTAPKARTETVVPTGGLTLSGTAPKARTEAVVPVGGLTLSGTAPRARAENVVPTGGVALSGTAPRVIVYDYVVSGGLVLTGTAARSRTESVSPSGGLTLSGAASTSLTQGAQEYVYSPSGGLVLSGSAARARTLVVTPIGGVLLSGTAARARTITYSASGGLVLSGSAQRTRTIAVVPSGGVLLSGTSPVARTRVYGATGGLALSGVALLSVTQAVVPTGGIVLAGEALTVLAGGGVFPYVPTGGLSLGGVSLVSFTNVYVASGGIALSGAAGTLLEPVEGVTYTYTPSGGVTLSGTAGIARSRQYFVAPSGGIVLSGSANVAVTRAFAPSGGVVIHGSASITRSYVYTGQLGGVSISGVALRARTTVYTPVGGVLLGGAASTAYTPPQVVFLSSVIASDTYAARARMSDALSPAASVATGDVVAAAVVMSDALAPDLAFQVADNEAATVEATDSKP